VYERRSAIRWSDLDAFGHVYHPVYLSYLEEARDAWLRDVLGAGETGWDYFVARVAIDYRDELRPADREVVARCAPSRVGGSSVTMAEHLVTADGRLVAEAEVVIVARDPETGRSRQLQPSERDALERELHIHPPTPTSTSPSAA
jgi:acyl-CoA thioester hydrolase